MLDVRVSLGNSLPCSRLDLWPSVIAHADFQEVSNILRCTTCISQSPAYIKIGVLFGSSNFAVQNYNIGVHFRLGCFCTADRRLQTSPHASFTKLVSIYLTLVPIMPSLPLLILVLPALRPPEFSPCELIQINKKIAKSNILLSFNFDNASLPELAVTVSILYF